MRKELRALKRINCWTVVSVIRQDKQKTMHTKLVLERKGDNFSATIQYESGLAVNGNEEQEFDE